MLEDCHDVCVEPSLQPVTGEILNGASVITEDDPGLDIVANDFGDRYEPAYFNVRVFNPLAPLNRQPLTACYRKHENIKKRAYKQRVREIKHGSFTLIVLSLTGRLAKRKICVRRGLPQ